VIVLDASALVELLLGTEHGRSIATRIADPTSGCTFPISPTSRSPRFCGDSSGIASSIQVRPPQRSMTSTRSILNDMHTSRC
jgi:hypothetical protein